METVYLIATLLCGIVLGAGLVLIWALCRISAIVDRQQGINE